MTRSNGMHHIYSQSGRKIALKVTNRVLSGPSHPPKERLSVYSCFLSLSGLSFCDGCFLARLAFFFLSDGVCCWSGSLSLWRICLGWMLLEEPFPTPLPLPFRGGGGGVAFLRGVG